MATITYIRIYSRLLNHRLIRGEIKRLGLREREKKKKKRQWHGKIDVYLSTNFLEEDPDQDYPHPRRRLMSR